MFWSCLSLSLWVALFPGSFILGKPAAMHETTRAVYGDIQVVRNLGLQTTLWASLEVDPLALVRPQMTDCSPSQQLSSTSYETLSQTT